MARSLKRRFFLPSWTGLSNDDRKKTHKVCEELLNFTWIRYGGKPVETCDGEIKSFLVHPAERDAFFDPDKYIADDEKYPRDMYRHLRIPAEMTGENFDNWKEITADYEGRSVEFSPGTSINDAYIMESAIAGKGDSWRQAYTQTLIDIVTKRGDKAGIVYFDHFNLAHATPMQRLEAAYQTVLALTDKPKRKKRRKT